MLVERGIVVSEAREIVTDKLRRYVGTRRELIPDTIHNTAQYANNRAEPSRQPMHARERLMRRFKSLRQAQRAFCFTVRSPNGCIDQGYESIPSEYRKLVVIITEAAIGYRLCGVYENLVAHGFTVTNALSSDSCGVRGAEWISSGNGRIEVVCDETVALRIESPLHEHCYDNFTMILFESGVSVLMPDNF